MALMAKHAYGSLANVDAALAAGTIDAYDVLFLKDGDKARIGWIDKDGNKVIVDGNQSVVTVESLPEVGEPNTVYICDSKFYFWNGSEFATTIDEIGISEAEVDEKINTATSDVVAKTSAYTDDKVEIVDEVSEKIKYEIAYKPIGTLVNYSEKEIRVMCPSNTAWTKQEVGANGDANKYYIGFKAYAPEEATSFKEGIGNVVDDEMFTFDDEFAGTDEYGRNYSIVWLPVAKYDEATDTWTYYGVNSSVDKYIGWVYSVEWYDSNGVLIASDRIRINLSNEDCHSLVEPFYVNNALNTAKAYTDEQIANIVGVEVIEF